MAIIPASIIAAVLYMLYKCWFSGNDGERKEKITKKEKNSQGTICERTPRLPGKWYLILYLLLIVISTGFAYNNLFGYYADKANVHERIYDQIRYETDKQLQIDKRIDHIVSLYSENTNNILESFTLNSINAVNLMNDTVEEMRDRIAKLGNSNESNENTIIIEYLNNSIAGLANSKSNINTVIIEYLNNCIMELRDDGQERGRLDNARVKYTNQTKDLESIITAIKSLVKMDYDVAGNNLTLKMESYEHFWGNSPLASYKTFGLVVEDPENSTDAETDNYFLQIGNYIEDKGEPIETVRKIDDNDPSKLTDETTEVIGRYRDPDSEDYSIVVVSPFVQEKVDKYIILEQLLNLYRERVNYINNYRIPGKDNFVNLKYIINTVLSSAMKSNIVFYNEINSWLSENAQIDDVRNNLVKLYRDNNRALDKSMQKLNRQTQGNTVSVQSVDMTLDIISVGDLPYIVDSYLNSEVDKAQNKEAAYEQLSDYIDRALSVNNVLGKFNVEDSAKGVEENAEDGAYKVRQYRNYAQGITNLNFQISYDALLQGNI